MYYRYLHQVWYVTLQVLLHESYSEVSADLQFDDWVNSCCKFPTFAFWNYVMNLESTLLLFVRAHRQGNFKLYVDCLRKLAELFLSCDHYNYARWVPVHILDMERLPASIANDFEAGKFVVHRSNKRFSSIAIDQAHEQLNKILKGTGVVGLTTDSSTLTKWSLSLPEVGKRLQDFEVSHSYNKGSEDFFHHDEGIESRGFFK